MMIHRPRAWYVLIGVAATLTAPGAAPADVFSAANDGILWVAWATYVPNRNEPTVRFGYTESPSLDAFRAPFEPRVGSIRHVAVSGKALHVVYAENAHYRFTSRDVFVELNVPGSLLPLAIAGRPDGDGIFAIISAADAREYVQSRLAATPATQPGETLPTDATRDVWRTAERLLADHPAARFWLSSYLRGDWSVVAPIPPELKLTVECWLVAVGNDLHLAWRERDDASRVLHAVRRHDVWTAPEPIAGAETARRAFLLAVNASPVFVAGVPSASGSGLNIEPFMHREGAWVRLGALELAGGPLTLAEDSFSVAEFAGKLAVTEQTKDESAPIRIAFWPVEGGPTTAPFAVPARVTPPPTSWLDSTLWDQLSYVVLFGVMILIFVRRQDSLLIPARLEPGFALAGFGRRIAAFVLDILPAFVVTIPLWIGPLQAISEAMPSLESDADPSPDELALARRLWLPWLAVRLVHTVYSIVFEATAGATPGKMAMALSVCRLDGGRAGIGPILTRNISRLIELEPLLTLWPMLLLVVMTRNRQRVGDLLARTVVREHQYTISLGDEPPTDGENQIEPLGDDDDTRRPPS
jgi:uncharacterized RDD family membrane protein YckC